MGKRFDELSKSFASGVSRRQALMGAIGGVGAAVAAAVLPGKGALADDDAARKCASFCAQNCGDPGYFINGAGTNPCTDQCIAEASMGQGLCFTVNGAPLYLRGCHGIKGECGPGKVCCNGRCCVPDLCVFTNGLVITNGLPLRLGHVCLGCPPSR
jgi:hypothetical protein